MLLPSASACCAASAAIFLGMLICLVGLHVRLRTYEERESVSVKVTATDASTIIFTFEGRQRALTVSKMEDTGAMVGTLRPIFYDRPTDAFSERFTSVKHAMRTISYVLLGIGLFMIAAGAAHLARWPAAH